jgi:hypothetical protein
VSLNRLSSVIRAPAITGYAASSGTGTTNISIVTTASIRFAINNLDFGRGAVNTTGGNTLCSLASGTASGFKDGANQCINFSAVGTLKSLQIENDGSLNLTVNLTSDKVADAFIGGGPSDAELFRFYVGNNETGSCSPAPFPTTWTSVSTNSTLICNATLATGGLGFITTANSLVLHINITIPSDSIRTSANNVATLTATGTTLV